MNNRRQVSGGGAGEKGDERGPFFTLDAGGRGGRRAGGIPRTRDAPDAAVSAGSSQAGEAAGAADNEAGPRRTPRRRSPAYRRHDDHRSAAGAEPGPGPLEGDEKVQVEDLSITEASGGVVQRPLLGSDTRNIKRCPGRHDHHRLHQHARRAHQADLHHAGYHRAHPRHGDNKINTASYYGGRN